MRALGIAVLVGVLAAVIIALPNAGAFPPPAHSEPAPAVFTMTNAVAGNQVIEYERAANGALTYVAEYATGGSGTGVSLADQGGLALTSDNHWLLVVDAGSNQVSVFRVGGYGGAPWLALSDLASSGGVLPVSIAISGNTVYVLNDGNSTVPGNIAGFHLASSGKLDPISGSEQALSTSAATAAAQVSFNPAGTLLVVTEKNTNLIDVYAVDWNGKSHPVGPDPSQGSTPYGFAFTPHGQLVVSEAASGSLSSYDVGAHGYWNVVSSSVPDYQVAPCWVVITPGGGYAYTSDGHSGNISSYTVGWGGQLTLLESSAAVTGAGPTDMSLASNGHLLYVYDAGAGEIQGFVVHSNGSLTLVDTTGGLPATAEGLAAV